MPFQEKSAWLMSVALLLGGVFYWGVVLAWSVDMDQLVHPNIPVVAVYTVILIVFAIVGHVLIAILAPREANAPLDERERRIMERAGHWSGYVLGVGVVMSLGYYLVSHHGDTLFYGILASLMLGQLAEYAMRIFLFRGHGFVFQECWHLL